MSGSDLAPRPARRRGRRVLARVGLAGKERVAREGPPLRRAPRARDRRGARRAAAPAVPRRADRGPGRRGHARLARAHRRLKRALTIVVIEHDMRFLFGLADRISVIHWGQVIARGTPAELRADPWVRARSLGSARVSARRARARRHRHLLRRDAGAVRRLARGRAPARWWRLLGPERRRQDDHAALDPRPDAAARAAASCFDGRDVTALAHARDRPRAASAGCPDDRRVFPTLTVARNLAIARKRTRFRAWTIAECFEIFSALEYLLHARMREPLRRRDADGGDLARAARLAGPGAARRAEPGPGAARSCRTCWRTIAAPEARRRRGAARRAERRRARSRSPTAST